jgi:hypothetical protein
MTAPAASLTPIFATPFAAAPLAGVGALNEELVQLFAARATEERREPDAPREALCYRSREDLFEWPDAPVVSLLREILSALCAAVRATTLHSDEEFSRLTLQARARFVLVRPNGCLPATSLPLASWCAVYCVAAPEPAAARRDSAALRLYEARMGTMFMDASNYRLREPFAGGHHMWRPGPGLLAAFPASLLHEIALNRGDCDLVLVIARARFGTAGQEAVPAW